MYDPENMKNTCENENGDSNTLQENNAPMIEHENICNCEDVADENSNAEEDPQITAEDAQTANEEETLPDETIEATEEASTLADSQHVQNTQAAQPQSASYAQPNYTNVNRYYQTPQPQNAYAYPQNINENVPRKKSKGKVAFLAISCVLLVLAVGIFAIVLTDGDNANANNGNGLRDVPNVTVVSSADAGEEGLSAAEVYQKVFKSSVSILAYQQSTGELGVLGSGVICQEDTSNKYTYIVTCAHVINDADYNIKVELWDGTVHTAEVVNFDDSNDIGVIRIRATGLQIAEFGNSDEIQPGATVYAIGSPYSSKFAGTFTRGMVSAVNRLVTTQTSYQLCCIQHDAPINHGNSGGALVNAFGQIIGINALKITSEGYEGLGFSVPSVTVIKVINSIIETGLAPKAPKLGISYVQAIYYSQFLSDLIEENNLPAGSIVIADINEDSSLYNTELQVNDIVTAVNGENLTTPDLLVQLIQNSNVGDSFELSVARIIMNEDGTDYVDIETFTVTATLVEKTEADKGAEQNDAQDDFYEYFGDDSGNYEDFYDYFYDYFYGGGNFDGSEDSPEGDNRFTIPE
ncbi:MAG: trypsin-like peptidase domain-containing protein [Clostridia bacterium]|nr:trypsin-like peptidase domain-containing protein [Clostridia bacterium]